MQLLNVGSEDLGPVLVDAPDLLKSLDDILNLHVETKMIKLA